MKPDWETVTPVLVHIQANLEGDLSLEALAKKAGLSPFHFQRIFKAAVGETPKTYASRLRLERAAFRLAFHEGSLLDLAIECGFQNHESFSRAFRRRFRCSPSQYRTSVLQGLESWDREDGDALDDRAIGYEISTTKVVHLRPVHVAFIRHAGPYESVPESIFNELERWAARCKVPGPPVWMGIGHDSPAATPAKQLRFDAALEVPGPFAPQGRVSYQRLSGGPFALTTHAGSYETLSSAYAAIFPRILRLRGYQPVGLPAIEIYHTARVNPNFHLNHTDIYLPVKAL